MGRLAWLCYDENGEVSIEWSEPPRYYHYKVVPIVYFELAEIK